MTGFSPFVISGFSLITSAILCAEAVDMVIITKIMASIMRDMRIFMQYASSDMSSPVVNSF